MMDFDDRKTRSVNFANDQKPAQPRRMTRKAARARDKELKLREEQQQAYDRFVFGGETFKEIGVALGRDQHTVSQWARDVTERRAAEIHDRAQLIFERNLAHLQLIQQRSMAIVSSGTDLTGTHGRNVVLASREINRMLGFSSSSMIAIETAPEKPALNVFTQETQGSWLRFAIACDPEKRDHPNSLLPFLDELKNEHLRREQERGNL